MKRGQTMIYHFSLSDCPIFKTLIIPSVGEAIGKPSLSYTVGKSVN